MNDHYSMTRTGWSSRFQHNILFLLTEGILQLCCVIGNMLCRKHWLYPSAFKMFCENCRHEPESITFCLKDGKQ